MAYEYGKKVSHENAHVRPENLDPRNNGPFLDDIRREQERAYRESRLKTNSEPETAETEEDNDSNAE